MQHKNQIKSQNSIVVKNSPKSITDVTLPCVSPPLSPERVVASAYRLQLHDTDLSERGGGAERVLH